MIGWLYVGDDGIEWSANHPVRSGEMPDARLIRRATNAELLSALKDAWEAHGEAVQSEGSLRTRLGELRSELEALRAAPASPAPAKPSARAENNTSPNTQPQHSTGKGEADVG